MQSCITNDSFKFNIQEKSHWLCGNEKDKQNSIRSTMEGYIVCRPLTSHITSQLRNKFDLVLNCHRLDIKLSACLKSVKEIDFIKLTKNYMSIRDLE